jgi:hypothetical protein
MGPLARLAIARTGDQAVLKNEPAFDADERNRRKCSIAGTIDP